jgi:hypothetical protein
MLDGVVLARKTGPTGQARGLKAHGAIRRPVLVALGLRPDGKKEVIDFHLAQGESAAEWERFLGDLIRRGLTGDTLQMICVDGGSGLLAALPTAYPGIPVQRCWAHKIRNVLAKVPQADQPAVKADLHAVMNAKTHPQHAPPRAASPTIGKRTTPGPSPACATISTSSSPAGATNPWPSARKSGPQTLSSDAFARFDGEPGRWASSQTVPRWTVSSSPSSTPKTKTRASAPLSC